MREVRVWSFLGRWMWNVKIMLWSNLSWNTPVEEFWFQSCQSMSFSQCTPATSLRTEGRRDFSAQWAKASKKQIAMNYNDWWYLSPVGLLHHPKSFEASVDKNARSNSESWVMRSSCVSEAYCLLLRGTQGIRWFGIKCDSENSLNPCDWTKSWPNYVGKTPFELRSPSALSDARRTFDICQFCPENRNFSRFQNTLLFGNWNVRRTPCNSWKGLEWAWDSSLTWHLSSLLSTYPGLSIIS